VNGRKAACAWETPSTSCSERVAVGVGRNGLCKDFRGLMKEKGILGQAAPSFGVENSAWTVSANGGKREGWAAKIK